MGLRMIHEEDAIYVTCDDPELEYLTLLMRMRAINGTVAQHTGRHIEMMLAHSVDQFQYTIL